MRLSRRMGSAARCCPHRPCPVRLSRQPQRFDRRSGMPRARNRRVLLRLARAVALPGWLARSALTGPLLTRPGLPGYRAAALLESWVGWPPAG